MDMCFLILCFKGFLWFSMWLFNSSVLCCWIWIWSGPKDHADHMVTQQHEIILADVISVIMDLASLHLTVSWPNKVHNRPPLQWKLSWWAVKDWSWISMFVFTFTVQITFTIHYVPSFQLEITQAPLDPIHRPFPSDAAAFLAVGGPGNSSHCNGTCPCFWLEFMLQDGTTRGD